MSILTAWFKIPLSEQKPHSDVRNQWLVLLYRDSLRWDRLEGHILIEFCNGLALTYVDSSSGLRWVEILEDTKVERVRFWVKQDAIDSLLGMISALPWRHAEQIARRRDDLLLESK